MAFAGFNNSRKRSTISNGDWDRDGVKNKKDCEPLNHKKQEGGSNGLSVDEWNRWKQKQLKFEGDKEKLNEFIQEGKTEFKNAQADAREDHGWLYRD